MTRGPWSGGGEDKHTSIRKIKVKKVENRNKAFKKKKKNAAKGMKTRLGSEKRGGEQHIRGQG